MRQRLLQIFQVPTDLDYVGSFQALAKVNLEMRRLGPSVERLLRKAQLERGAGNTAAALLSAQDALVLDPAHGETHYQLGITFLHLALAKAEALPTGPVPTDLPRETARELLEKAVAAFRAVLSLNPNDDDARQDEMVLQSLMERHPTDSGLAAALRSRTA